MKRRLTQRQPSEKKVAGPLTLKRTRSERSVVSRLMGILKSGGDARTSKVKRVRQSVRSKTYENDLKLTVALERMARDLSA